MENIKRRKMDDPDNNFRGHLAELMTGDTLLVVVIVVGIEISFFRTSN